MTEPQDIPQLAMEAEIVAEPQPAVQKAQRATFREYAESLLVTVVLALFGTTFVVQAFKIPSPSMEPTLLIGDHLLVNKFVYGGNGAWYERALPYREIGRGDIIVFKFPYDDHPHYVKRVIGLPRDRVRIVDQQVYVNGQPLSEPYKAHSGHEDPYGANFPAGRNHFAPPSVRAEWAAELPRHVRDGELLVPEGKYFALGDNRDTSLDSRYWGFVDREAVMGRPLLIYWSLEAAQGLPEPTWSGRLIGLANTVIRLPANTRWGRMFRRVR